MKRNQYDLTFDEIYGWFAESERIAEENARKSGDGDGDEYRRYAALSDFFTTLLRFREQPEYRCALEDAINDYWESKDVLVAFLKEGDLSKPNAILDVLLNRAKRKWSDVCALFDVPIEHDAANDLRDALDSMFFRRRRPR